MDEASLDKLLHMKAKVPGVFGAKAQIAENGNVLLRVSQRFNVNLLPIGSFDDLLDVLDSLAEFNDASIVLKKK